MLNNTTINPTSKTFRTIRASLCVSLYVLIIKMPITNRATVKIVPNSNFIYSPFFDLGRFLALHFIISHCYLQENSAIMHNSSKIFINLEGIFCIFFRVVSIYANDI